MCNVSIFLAYFAFFCPLRASPAAPSAQRKEFASSQSSVCTICCHCQAGTARVLNCNQLRVLLLSSLKQQMQEELLGSSIHHYRFCFFSSHLEALTPLEICHLLQNRTMPWPTFEIVSCKIRKFSGRQTHVLFGSGEEASQAGERFLVSISLSSPSSHSTFPFVFMVSTSCMMCFPL